MLSAPRRLLANSPSALRYTQHSLLAPSFVVGSSKDLEFPSHPFSTSSSSWNSQRIKLSKEKVAERVKKIKRKQSIREERKLLEQAKGAEKYAGNLERNLELKEKRITSEELTEGLAPLTEEQLEGMYRGLLSAPPSELASPALEAPSSLLLEDSSAVEAEGREDRLAELEQRLEAVKLAPEGEETSDSLASRLSARLRRDDVDAELGEEDGASTPTVAGEETSSPRRVLRKLGELVKASESLAASPSSEASAVEELAVPLGLVVRSEWRDLLLSAAEEEGAVGDVLEGLSLMQKLTPMEDGKIITDILATYASRGRTRDALSLVQFARERSLPMSVTFHHHLLSTLLPSHPELALKHLYSLEASGHTPLLATYTNIIRNLLAPSSPPHLVSRGWDLYAHTRLVSHPVPDVALYSEMIQACSRGPHPSPERALDLFTEMTVDNKLPPSEQAYNGVIRACAKEGSQPNYFEALRLMRQMLDTNVMPSRHTFHAVLEGAMRHGDLARARWMLVKMVGMGGDSAPDPNTMGLVFQTYAAHRPPVSQNKTPRARTTATYPPRPSNDSLAEVTSVEGVTSPEPSPRPPVDPPASSSVSASTEEPTPSTTDIIELLGESSLFYPGPLPQTADELLVEARNLMMQCVGADALPPSTDDLPPSHLSLFPAVMPTPFLLNSYLSVLANHGPFPDLADFFDTTYSKLGVEKNRHAFEKVMEKCETAKNREVGLKVARETFAEWQQWLTREVEEDGVKVPVKRSGNNISAMWSSMIRVLARNYANDEALALLKTFIATYPPTAHHFHAVQRRFASSSLPYLPNPLKLSSVLYPETRFSSEDDRPPRILFDDVKILHLRLRNVDDSIGVRTVTGITKMYEGAVARSKEVEEGRPRKDLERRRWRKEQEQASKRRGGRK
ncbi:hypothetical protein BCR35DRAFT_304725 [Leucosporidium creatinivorum]|uniref:Pentacotripeptide-repeat region of PRORP domain-containing protein n=1 Tax=Leucosporidium creatinivorum TaxID=106004 RepID=A0A1Y2F5Z4_9BASI|nr:hypothetical protein BCR35DRAFT_304725 [Leucosporidium creatinivorum]